MHAQPLIRIFLRTVALLALLMGGHGFAQTPEEVRNAFKNLHDDNIKWNCTEAMDWLYERRETLKDAMAAEVYQTDWQGREALIEILSHTKGFDPDDRFIQSIIIPEISKEPRGKKANPSDPSGKPEHGGLAVGNRAWFWVDTHYEACEPTLLAQIRDRKRIRNAWIATWFFKKHGTLSGHFDLYTPEVMDWIESSLRDDNVSYNATQAARIFLLLGDFGLPTLQKATQDSDVQAASFARALIDAMKGSRDAFGFLGSKLVLSGSPYGRGLNAPDWMEGLEAANLDRKKYP